MKEKILFVSTHGIGDLAMQFSAMSNAFNDKTLYFIVSGKVEHDLVKHYYPDAVIFELHGGLRILSLARVWLRINFMSFHKVFAQYNVNRWKFFFFTILLRNRFVISDRLIDAILFNRLHKGRLHKIDAMSQWSNVVTPAQSYNSTESYPFKHMRHHENIHYQRQSKVSGKLNILLAISSFEEEKYKRWPIEYYSQLCRLLSDEFKCSFALYGSKEEYDYCNKLVMSNSDLNISNFCGSVPFKSVLNQISEFDLAICNCNAFSHLTSLEGIPTVGIYGPTNFKITGIYDVENNLVINSEKFCAPCYGYGGPCLNPTCLSDLKPNFVFGKIRDFVNRELI
jgi:ADP-heptose:LPS heptosyltransferase